MDLDWQDIATLLAVLGAVGCLLRHGIRVLTAEPGCGCAVCEQCSPDPGQQTVQIDVPGARRTATGVRAPGSGDSPP